MRARPANSASNVVTRPVWKEMVDSANGFPEDDSEFAETGLTPIPGMRVKAPRVKEAPIHFECKLERVLELGPKRQALMIGEVVYIHVDPAVMTNGYIDRCYIYWSSSIPGRPHLSGISRSAGFSRTAL